MNTPTSDALYPRKDIAERQLDPTVDDRGSPGSQARRSLSWRFGYAVGNCFQLLVLGGMLDFLLFFNADIVFWLRLFLLGFILFAVSRGMAWAVLLAVLTSLVVREVPQRFTSLEVLSLCYSIFAGLVLLYTLQADSVRNSISGGFASLSELTFGKSSANSGSGRSNKTTENPDTNVESQARATSQPSGSIRPANLVIQIIVFATLAVLCMFALDWLPNSITKRNELFRLVRVDSSAMSTILLAMLTVFVLLREFAWKQLNTRQAGVFLRSQYLHEYHREFGTFYRRRIKMDKKQARKANS